MRAWHFSENAYHLLPDAKEYDSIRVTLPNRYYDPKLGADLYHRYIDEWLIAEDLGLEIMVNEHHQTATNLNPAAPVITRPVSPGELQRALETHFLSKLEYLNAIGIALSQERDINKLLETILIGAKNLTHADGGTLYRLVDGKLQFEIMRTDR